MCFGRKSRNLQEQFLKFMQQRNQKLLRFLGSWIINTLAVLVTVEILHNHITYEDKLKNLLVASFLLGILNAFVRPILMLIALPLLIFTLGLFTLVINALLLSLLTVLLPFFHITSDGVHFSFGYAFLGALIISIISSILNALTGNSRISVHRRPPGPPRNSGGGGGGPVIDV
ncbi:MAG TPA: phage holin family protein [Verrucomicrobiae bacterium]